VHVYVHETTRRRINTARPKPVASPRYSLGEVRTIHPSYGSNALPQPPPHDTAAMRRDYAAAELTEQQAGDDPLALFARWFAQAKAERPGDAQWYEVNAMTLATVDAGGRPAARIVLLKDFDEDGLVFFTNYESQKASHIATNPVVALCMHWPWLERQVRIEGRASQIDREASEAYFASRPRGSQLGAWVSNQSEPITRQQMAHRLADLERRFKDRDIPCPPHWGGYRVEPAAIEFWQGRPNRLHDRLLFTRTADGWQCRRLGP